MPMPVDWPRPSLRDLVHGHVGQGAGAGDDADIARAVDPRGHDPDLALSGRDDARAIRPDQARTGGADEILDLDHVQHRDAFADADDQGDAGQRRFDDGVGGKRGRHKNDRHIGRRFALTASSTVLKTGFSRWICPPLPGVMPPTTLRAVFDHLRGMKSAFAAGKTLNNHSRFFIDQNGHAQSPLASSTTRRTASASSFSVMKFNCDSRRILMPSSSLVPTRRMTMGILMSMPLTA